MNQNASENVQQITTMPQLNDMLAQAGFQPLTKEQVSELNQAYGRQRVLWSVANCLNDAQALRFLQSVIPSVNGETQEPQQEQPQGYSQPKGSVSRPSGNAGSRREFKSLHVYAFKKAALTFSADETRSGLPTVRVEGAIASGQQFDWANKTGIQLTRHELPELVAVFFGIKQSVEFKNHGLENNKGMSAEVQGDKVFVKVWEKDKPLKAVPVHPQDRFHVSALLLGQLCKLTEHETGFSHPQSILSMLSRFYGG